MQKVKELAKTLRDMADTASVVLSDEYSTIKRDGEDIILDLIDALHSHARKLEAL